MTNIDGQRMFASGHVDGSSNSEDLRGDFADRARLAQGTLGGLLVLTEPG